MITGIYAIDNLVNRKIYIGSARSISNRKNTHFNTLRKGKHKNPYLQKSFNKYGENNFRFFIIEEHSNSVTENYLRSREDTYIKLYKSMSYERGYNLLSAFRKEMTERHYQIVLDANKKAQIASYKKVYQHDLDGKFIRSHISVNAAAKFLFPELTEAQITKDRKGSLIGCVCNNKRNSAYGYRWSYETFIKFKPIKIKIAKQQIVQNDLNGNPIKYYSSMNEAAREFKVNSSCIYQSILRGHIFHKQYRFKRV
jgi:group I intron endonuclease